MVTPAYRRSGQTEAVRRFAIHECTVPRSTTRVMMLVYEEQLARFVECLPSLRPSLRDQCIDNCYVDPRSTMGPFAPLDQSNIFNFDVEPQSESLPRLTRQLLPAGDKKRDRGLEPECDARRDLRVVRNKEVSEGKSTVTVEGEARVSSSAFTSDGKARTQTSLSMFSLQLKG